MSGPFLASYVFLWLLVLVMAIALIALYSHFGRMYLNSREGRATQGPPKGEQLRKTKVTFLDGHSAELPSTSPTLLLFADTGCPLCKRLLPGIGDCVDAEECVETVVVCGGRDATDVERWAAEVGTGVPVIWDERHRLAIRFGIGITPFIVAVGADGTVQDKGLVNDLEGVTIYSQIARGTPTDSTMSEFAMGRS